MAMMLMHMLDDELWNKTIPIIDIFILKNDVNTSAVTLVPTFLVVTL